MNNTSTYGWFQLDLSGKGVGEAWHASNDGETEMADATDPRGGAALCALEGAVLTGFGTCLFDTNLGDNRSNQRGLGDYRGEMQRSQIFIFTNHEFDNGIELFNELGYYTASSSRDISAGSFRGGVFQLAVIITGSHNYLKPLIFQLIKVLLSMVGDLLIRVDKFMSIKSAQD